MSRKSVDNISTAPGGSKVSLKGSRGDDNSSRWISTTSQNNRDDGGNNIGNVYELLDDDDDEGDCSLSHNERLDVSEVNKATCTQIQMSSSNDEGTKNEIQNIKRDKKIFSSDFDCHRGRGRERERKSSIVISNLVPFHRLSDITTDTILVDVLKDIGPTSSTQQPRRKHDEDNCPKRVNGYEKEEEKERDEVSSFSWNVTAAIKRKCRCHFSRRCFSSAMTRFLAPGISFALFVLGAVVLFRTASSEETFNFDRQGWMGGQSSNTTRPSISNSPTTPRPTLLNAPSPSPITKSSLPSLSHFPSAAAIVLNTFVKVEYVGTCQYTDTMGDATIKALESTYHGSNDISISVEIVRYSEVCASELRGIGRHPERINNRVHIFANIVQRMIGSEGNRTDLKDKEQILKMAKANKVAVEKNVSHSIGKKITFRMELIVEDRFAFASPSPLSAPHPSERKSHAPSTSKSTPTVDAKSNLPTFDFSSEQQEAPSLLNSKMPIFTTMKPSLKLSENHSAKPTMRQSISPTVVQKPKPSGIPSYNPSSFGSSHNPSSVPSFNPSHHELSQPASLLISTHLPSFPAAVVANAPASCKDYPYGWVDADGINCEYYAHPGYCGKFGKMFASAGKTANQACCICGGGTTDGINQPLHP